MTQALTDNSVKGDKATLLLSTAFFSTFEQSEWLCMNNSDILITKEYSQIHENITTIYK